MQVGVLVGPAIGGLLVAYVGIGWCFLVDIVGLVRRHRCSTSRCGPTRTAPRPRRPAWPASARACATRWRRRDLLGTYLVDIAAMLLAMPVVLFPALAEEVFRPPRAARAALLRRDRRARCSPPRLSGWTSRVHRHGRAIVVAAAAYGACIALAGLMPSIWLVARLPRCCPAPPTWSRAVFRSTVWNQTIPEDMRGPAGRHRDAVLLPRPARRPGPRRLRRRPVVGARLDRQRRLRLRRRRRRSPPLWLRDFWSYDARTDEHAVAERAVRAAAGELSG